jgi:hypothetical protein
MFGADTGEKVLGIYTFPSGVSQTRPDLELLGRLQTTQIL